MFWLKRRKTMDNTKETVTFTQKWIEKAVRNFLKNEKEPITAQDLAQIKYLKIGESFDNDFIIELSEQRPPEPFADTDGGDEWIFALQGEDIRRFLTDTETDLHCLSAFGFEYEENHAAGLKETRKNWNDYRETVYQERYYEEIADDEQWEQWYEETKGHIYQDLRLFTGLIVLRIYGTSMPDYTSFAGMGQLAVMELVETCFADTDGVEKLYGLKQLSCWLD